MLSKIVILGLLWLFAGSDAFYLPGTATDYLDGDPVPVDVNVIQSVHTHLPFEYYSMKFCKPPYSVKKEIRGNIGETLLGDRIRKSPYDKIQMNIAFRCKAACTPIPIDKKMRELFEERIREEYTVTLILDDLPVTIPNPDKGTFSVGFPIGIKDGEKYVLYNHLDLTVKYHPVTSTVNGEEKEVKRIVAFNVHPYSIKHPIGGGKVTGCDEKFDATKAGHQRLTTAEEEFTFTYAVQWEETNDVWATRWDPYISGGEAEIHWFSIVNSLMIVLFLTGMVAVIMMRTLRKDISRYNAPDEEELAEETGWKMVHGDVFRPPERCSLLAVYAGTGSQMNAGLVIVLVFACLGFLSPANRGGLFTCMLLCFVFLGVHAGYTCARLMKMWGKYSWKTTLLTATLIPGEIFTLFFIINLFVWNARSSVAVPFPTILAVVGLWFFISTPLVFVGSVWAYKRPALELPTQVHHIPRHIPEQPWYMKARFTIMMGGILPFGAVFIELFFILTSIWLHRYYYVFGFLFIVFVILVITCAEITIVMIYFQLCSEDYRWWWRSFFTSASSGGYLFLYTVFYFFTSMKMKRFVSVLIFFGYMGIASYLFAIMTGTMGFLSCLLFIRKIYSALKVD